MKGETQSGATITKFFGPSSENTAPSLKGNTSKVKQLGGSTQTKKHTPRLQLSSVNILQQESRVDGKKCTLVKSKTVDVGVLVNTKHIKTKISSTPCKQHSNKIDIYQDPESSKSSASSASSVSVGVQTDTSECCHCSCHKEADDNVESAEDEAFALMCSDTPSADYWQQLAEERRKALASALQENEDLHGEIKRLEEDNLNLSGMAEKADYFANLFQSLTEDSEKDENIDVKADESGD